MKRIKKKKKAFIGAILAGVGALAGGISSMVKARKQANVDQKNYELQQGQIYANEAQDIANASTQEMNDRGYIDAMKKRISFKMGGNYKPRFKQKAEEGGEYTNTNNSTNTKTTLGNNLIGDILGGASGLISGAFDIAAAAQNQKEYRLHNNTPINAAPTKILQPQSNTKNINQTPYNQYNIPYNNQNINPVLNNIMRCGGKRIKKRNTNRFK